MTKISVLFMGAALLSGSVVANTAPAKKFVPYAGIQFGGANLTSKVSSTTTSTTMLGLKSGGRVSDMKLMVGAHVGFDYYVMPSFAAGLDVNYDITNLKATYTSSFEDALPGQNIDGNVVSLNQRDSANVAARFKYVLNDTAAPYVKVGYSSASFKAQSQVNTADIANTAQRTANNNKRLSGLLLGAGIDLKVAPHVRMGLDFTYVQYKELKLTHSFTELAGARSVTRSIKPSASALQVRVSYVF